MLDPDIVFRFTGQRQVTSVEDAAALLARAQTPFERARRNHRAITSRLRATVRALRWLGIRQRIAMWPGRIHIAGWVIALSIAGAMSFTSGLLAVFVLGTGLGCTVLLTLLPVAIVLPLCPLAFPSRPDVLNARAQDLSRLREITARDARLTEGTLRDAHERLESARALHQGLVRARDYPLNRLLNANFRAMSGPEFEDYVAEIFRYLGYTVQQTGRSGDQGVDVVVARGAERLAIQTKCYAGSVGNFAVQEVFTGMVVHRCQRCVVIASSAFTAAAKNAAHATGCKLIGGSELPDLIRGRISL